MRLLKAKRRLPWPALMVLFLLGALGMSVAGYSETYNFYFEKKKTEGKDEEEAAPVVPPPAQVPTPIVINNNNTNNVGTPAAVTTNNNAGVASAPVGAPASLPTLVSPAPAPVGETSIVTAAFSRPPERSPWRMSLTGMAFFQEYPKSYLSNGEKKSSTAFDPTWGGLLSVGYNFSRFFAVNLYGGLRVADVDTKRVHTHLGADLEFMPFRIPVSERHDIFELGFLLGGSTALAAKNKNTLTTFDSAGKSVQISSGESDNWGRLHVGVRVNINIVPEFGITTSARGNLGSVLIEGGIVARL